MAGWTAGTPTTESTMHISPIEMYLSFAKVGAKLIEMPVFVCFFCARNGCFCAEMWAKIGVLWLKFWGEGGKAKRQSKHHVFDFGTLFVMRVRLCI